MIAFENQYYGEIIIHPPPISSLIAPILIFIAIKPLMRVLNKLFSYMIFWLENIVFTIFFTLYEFLLVPIVYAKIFINILTCSYGLFTTIFKCIIWVFSGFFFSIFLAFRDIYYLLKILSMH